MGGWGESHAISASFGERRFALKSDVAALADSRDAFALLRMHLQISDKHRIIFALSASEDLILGQHAEVPRPRYSDD